MLLLCLAAQIRIAGSSGPGDRQAQLRPAQTRRLSQTIGSPSFPLPKFIALFSSLRKKTPTATTAPVSATSSPTTSRTGNAAPSSSHNNASSQEFADDLVLASRRSMSPESEDRLSEMDAPEERDRESERRGRKKLERNGSFVVEVEVKGKKGRTSGEKEEEEEVNSLMLLEKGGRKKVVREEEREEVASSMGEYEMSVEKDEMGADEEEGVVEDEEEEEESTVEESDKSVAGDEEGSAYGSQDDQEDRSSDSEDEDGDSTEFKPISASTKKQLDSTTQSRSFKKATSASSLSPRQSNVR